MPKWFTANRRSRWSLIYLGLAAFDLIAIVVSLGMNHYLTTLYQRSVDFNTLWSQRLSDVAAMGSAATKANVAGNDIFDGLDLEVQQAAFASYTAQIRLIHEQLVAAVGDDPEQVGVHEALAMVSRQAQHFESQGQALFSAFARGGVDEAGGHMAVFDRSMGELSGAMGVLRNAFAERVDQHLRTQAQTARRIRRAEMAVAGCIVFMVAGVLVYAHALSRHMGKIEDDRDEALRQVRDREAAIDVAGIVAFTDARGTITYANDKFCQLSGYSREELIGRNHRILNSGYHDHHFFKEMYATIASGRPWRGEIRNRAKDGSFYWVDTTIVPMFDTRQAITGYMSLRMDITDRKRSEAQLAHATRLLEQTTRLSGVGGWEVDLTSMTPLWSDEVFRIHEVKPGEQPTMEEAINFYAPEARQRVRDAIAAAVERGEPFDLELPFITAKGRRLMVRSTGTAEMEHGRCIRLYGAFQDITPQYEAREQLRTLATRLETATRGAGVGVWDLDLVQATLWWDRAMHDIYGTDPAQPATMDLLRSRVHEEDLPATQERFARALEHDEPYTVQFRIRRPVDGSIRHIHSSATIERDASGRAVRAVGINMDITPQVLAAQALQQARHDAEAASRAKSDFLANMSHEIRTPMTAILGYTDLIMDPGTATADFESHVATIRSNAEHLLTIINDILDMSKIEAGRMSVESIETRPAQLVEEVASLVGARAKLRNVDLRVRYDTPVPLRIQSDPTRLRQILLNLAGNAIKFTKDGSVTVHVAADPAARRIAFRVVDTGIGMTPEQRDTIARFEAFTQADSTMSRKFGGTGLGLRISHVLAQMLGGGLDVQSELGRGSTFTVTVATGDLTGVPMFEPERVPTLAEMKAVERRRESPTPESGSGPELQGLRILLAEDGVDNQRLITFHLKKAGAAVTVAENGQVAVDHIRGCTPQSLPHVVLMDMQMPLLDGYSAVMLLRREGCRLPIIALTAHAMSGDRERCLSAGCDDYLTKPIDKAQLVERCAALACATTA